MNPWKAVGLALVAAAGSAFAVGAQIAPTLVMNADGEVQITTDGKVSDYRLTSALPPGVATLVDKDVRSWAFEPIVVDGSPVVARTAMHLSLKAEPAGANDQYRIRITEVRFGEPHRNSAAFKVHPPRYPESAVRAHLSAVVMLAVQLDDAGKVVEAQPYQTSIDGRAGSEADAERWRKLFEQASVTAARTWQYDLTETINGKPIRTNAFVPVVFSIAGSARPGAWKAYVPGPVHAVPWLSDKSIASDLSALGDGEALALDSRFHLKQDVVGSTL